MKELNSLMPVLGEKRRTLSFLKLAIDTFNAFSREDNNLWVHVDGENQEIQDFLDEMNVQYTTSEWQGLTHTLDRMIRESDSKYVIPLHDDLVFSPGWDTNLLDWLDNSNSLIVNPHLIGHGPPKPRGYKKEDTYFGENPEDFDMDVFLSYVERAKTSKLLPWRSGVQCMKKSFYIKVGGFDLEFSPHGFFDLDFHYRCMLNYPNMSLMEAQNSILYHFSSIAKKELNVWKEIGDIMEKKFENKWGITFHEGHKQLEGWLFK